MATSPRTKTAASPKTARGTGRRKKAGSKKRSTAAKAAAASRSANTTFNDIDKLRDDLVKLSQSVSALLTSRATDARDLVTETASDYYDTGVEYAQDAQLQVRGMASDVAKQVQSNPLAAVGIVFGVGYLIGLMRRK
ncbi:hypothetical protein IZ6_12380 [Terrihabitans soli]|uniref:DUF883 domain-containing protein n=1 Tax=Terrihabitans soli TaxID=708113 RepID=A0A6S6QH61_9HYPH|nr:hypothetical protein [Terrihabitans soli]BCJ90503.1 hypothetical protein IZ6_12380 [Terrihabitans soli]